MIKETYIASQHESDIIERYLVQEDDSAVLQWMYDGVGTESYCTRKILSVHLTADEFDKVTQRNSALTGILEPVRQTLSNPHVKILFVKSSSPYSFSIVDHVLDLSHSEEEFLESIDNILPPSAFGHFSAAKES